MREVANSFHLRVNMSGVWVTVFVAVSLKWLFGDITVLEAQIQYWISFPSNNFVNYLMGSGASSGLLKDARKPVVLLSSQLGIHSYSTFGQ